MRNINHKQFRSSETKKTKSLVFSSWTHHRIVAPTNRLLELHRAEPTHAATDTRFCSCPRCPPPYLATEDTGGCGAPDMVDADVAARTDARPAVGQPLLLLLLPFETPPIDMDDGDVIAASTAILEASYELPPRRCWTALAAARLAYTVDPGMEPDPTPAQLPYLGQRFRRREGGGGKQRFVSIV